MIRCVGSDDDKGRRYRRYYERKYDRWCAVRFVMIDDDDEIVDAGGGRNGTSLSAKSENENLAMVASHRRRLIPVLELSQ